MTIWSLMIFLHLLSMAFFVGGQLFMAAIVLPALRGEENKEKLRLAARYFLYASGVALVVLLITGTLLASHFQMWSDPTLHTKLALVGLTIALILWHRVKSKWHWLEGVIFIVSLVIVYLGIELVGRWG